jgi:putative two-component system response regulator
VEEFEEMKKHTIYGCKTLLRGEAELGNVNSSFLTHGREIAYTHHEKWDGSGYPQGLSGDTIPISGRLMAVADVYDALISKRVYKQPFTHAKAIDIMKEGKGRHFDPDILDAFLDVEGEFRRIAQELSDSEMHEVQG